MLTKAIVTIKKLRVIVYLRTSVVIARDSLSDGRGRGVSYNVAARSVGRVLFRPAGSEKQDPAYAVADEGPDDEESSIPA